MMRRFMGRILAPFGNMWAGLSARERMLLRALGIAFLFVVTLLLFYLRATRIDAIDRSIARTSEAIALLRTKGAQYAERKKKSEKKSGRFSETPLLFSSHLEGVTAKVPEVQITNQEEQTPVELAAGLRKRTVAFDVRSVTYEALLRFLALAEQVPGHVVMVDGLRIRSASPNEDRIHAAVRLSTWEKAPEPDEKETGT